MTHQKPAAYVRIANNERTVFAVDLMDRDCFLICDETLSGFSSAAEAIAAAEARGYEVVGRNDWNR